MQLLSWSQSELCRVIIRFLIQAHLTSLICLAESDAKIQHFLLAARKMVGWVLSWKWQEVWVQEQTIRGCDRGFLKNLCS